RRRSFRRRAYYACLSAMMWCFVLAALPMSGNTAVTKLTHVEGRSCLTATACVFRREKSALVTRQRYSGTKCLPRGTRQLPLGHPPGLKLRHSHGESRRARNGDVEGAAHIAAFCAHFCAYQRARARRPYARQL